MRETRSSGSVEGVVGNHDSYSDSTIPPPVAAAACYYISHMKALAFGFALLQAATGALVPPPGARYVCLLDPEVSSDRPIPCPVCGYDLIPEELARSGLAAFTCPEHREIQQSTPGK